jgi:CRP-like cAMP-binding protein
MTKTGRRKHFLTEKTKILSAKALAQKVGYLKTSDFRFNFDSLPRLTFSPGRPIKSKDNLYVVRSGSVALKHVRHKFRIRDILPGYMFGNLPLLGQTMALTESLAGKEGTVLGVLDIQTARRLIDANSIRVLEVLGPRLASVETELYRARFQSSDSRLAAFILKLSETNKLEGLSHTDLGHMTGMYRETVTNTLSVIEENKMIEIKRKKITILDKQALQELSEL